MRTIKFRGYSKDFAENEWFFGNLIDKGNGSFQILEKNPKIWDLSYDGIEVLPESIGQFTGLHDKNGKEIYEGDIIGDWTEIDGKMEQSRLTVYFDEMLGQWMIDISFNQDFTTSCPLFSELKYFEYEVLGNIHENPELL